MKNLLGEQPQWMLRQPKPVLEARMFNSKEIFGWLGRANSRGSLARGTGGGPPASASAPMHRSRAESTGSPTEPSGRLRLPP